MVKKTTIRSFALFWFILTVHPAEPKNVTRKTNGRRINAQAKSAHNKKNLTVHEAKPSPATINSSSTLENLTKEGLTKWDEFYLRQGSITDKITVWTQLCDCNRDTGPQPTPSVTEPTKPGAAAPSSSGKQIVGLIKEGDNCNEIGQRYQDPKLCQQYYVCKQTNKRQYWHKFSCPDEGYYDEDEETCIVGSCPYSNKEGRSKQK